MADPLTVTYICVDPGSTLLVKDAEYHPVARRHMDGVGWLYEMKECPGQLFGLNRFRVKLPQRIQLSRAKGWRMPENTVKVDRSTVYGNPFPAGKPSQAAEAVRVFRHWICETDPWEYGQTMDERRRPNLTPLRGKNLACWCKPGAPCHADVLLELANREAA